MPEKIIFDNQHPLPSLSFHAGPREHDVLISVEPPLVPAKDSLNPEMLPSGPPLNVVFLVNTSESMGSPRGGTDGTPRLSGLDLAKRILVRMLIAGASPNIITYSTKAMLLARKNYTGLQESLAMITTLKPEKGVGDVWKGLSSAFELLAEGSEDYMYRFDLSDVGPLMGIRNPSTEVVKYMKHTVSKIFILTDAAGYSDEQQSGLLDKLRSRLAVMQMPVTISAFILGAHSKPQLYHEITKLGHGTIGIIGYDWEKARDIAAHALANLRMTYADDFKVEIFTNGPLGACNAIVAGSMRPLAQKSVLPLGTLHYGQSRDLVLTLPAPISETMSLIVTVRCRIWDRQDHITMVSVVDPSTVLTLEEDTEKVSFHRFRAELSSIAAKAVPLTAIGIPPGLSDSFADLSRRIRGHAESIKNGATKEALLLLGSDLDGRVLGALKDDVTYEKNGRATLLSLARAHRQQERVNSLEQSVQVYSGDATHFLHHITDIQASFDNVKEPGISTGTQVA